MTALARITAEQRRSRLVRRHLHAPTTQVDTAHEVAEALIGLHATDPATVFLAAAARMQTPTVEAIDRTLYDTPSGTPVLERIRCMRRTMFVVPAHLAPVVHSATAQDTDRLRTEAADKLAQALGWDQRRYTAVERDMFAALAARGEATAAQLATDVPALREQLTLFPGKPYESRQRVSATILGVLAAEGRIRRTRPVGSWTSAQFRWAHAHPLPTLPAAEARAELARHYLAAFGPATADDVKWWTGWNLTHTRKAIAATGAQAVELHEGTGYLLPDDLQDVEVPEPSVALLPGLDPTSMGWRHRAWYTDPAHTAALFDRNGNIGPPIWWNGHIIGAWAQHVGGHINHHLLTDPGTAARAAVHTEIERLTAFLATTCVTPAYRTPLERRLAQGDPSA
ncbi:winged helix DNA-binding domain-containing protein [Streptomyces sp. NRRL F-4428]|uniref:winged helix DNA-binding domain-containing protein n=1 Tax=Streptomyces sp. NRRL F-4428 TaxID=1609137 RepID=UPI0005ECDD4F|nr:winged helix DNA-binding domain-containing protein [Streptomyces sp. NRRL F-4428]KJK53589.1 hypothetical protein UK14_06395 [Streptomyces sp. NRRL F-4428]